MTMTHNAAAQTPVKKSVNFSLILIFAMIGLVGGGAFSVFLLADTAAHPTSFGIYEKNLTITEFWTAIEDKDRDDMRRVIIMSSLLITLASSLLGTYIALLRARKGVEALVFFPALFGAVAGVILGYGYLVKPQSHLEGGSYYDMWGSMSQLEKIHFRDEVITIILIAVAVTSGIGLILCVLRGLVGSPPSPAAIERSNAKKQVRQLNDSVDARVRSLPKHKKVAMVVAVDDEKEMLYVNTAWISIAKPKWVSIRFEDLVRWEANWLHKGSEQVQHRVIFFVRGEQGPTIELRLTTQKWRERVTGLLQANFS